MEKLKPKMTIKVDDFMGEEEEESTVEERKKLSAIKNLDIEKILSNFVLK